MVLAPFADERLAGLSLGVGHILIVHKPSAVYSRPSVSFTLDANYTPCNDCGMIDLKTWRTQREFTQAQVAELIGTNVPNVSRIETGNQWPGPELMARIEEATNGEVTASAILQVYREKNVAAE